MILHYWEFFELSALKKSKFIYKIDFTIREHLKYYFSCFLAANFGRPTIMIVFATLFITSAARTGASQNWPDTKPTGVQKNNLQIKATQFAKTFATLLESSLGPPDHPVGKVIKYVLDKDK